MQRYKIADVVIDVETKYSYTKEICADYEYSGNEPPCFSVKISDEDVLYEKQQVKAHQDLPEFSDAYLESVSLFRKFSEYLFEKANGIIFHCSAIAVDNKGYLFTGKSGAGKSTHARLWREYLGEKAIAINDDKPVVRKIGDKFFVYGTPWTGKHKIGANAKAEIKAICGIVQDKQNSIEQMNYIEALSVILNQTMRPETKDGMNKLIDYAEDMLKSIKAYNLKCNVSIDAVKLSFGTMNEGG